MNWNEFIRDNRNIIDVFHHIYSEEKFKNNLIDLIMTIHFFLEKLE